MKPCCLNRNLAFLQEVCTKRLVALYTQQFQLQTYDPVKGNACLDAFARASDIDICTDDLSGWRGQGSCEPSGPARLDFQRGPPCDWAFEHKEGNLAPGSDCTAGLDDGCAFSSDGPVLCVEYMAYEPLDFPSRSVCQIVLPGHDGDACDEGTHGALSDLPATIHECVQTEGLFCQKDSSTCIPLGRVGDACTNSDECTCATYCGDSTCRVRAEPGAPCTPDSYYDLNDPCTPGYYCDGGSLVCIPLKSAAASCGNYWECQGDCINGVCDVPLTPFDKLVSLCGG